MLDEEKILRVICTGVESLDLHTVLQERPEAMSEPSDEFLVVSLPTGFRSRVISGQEGDFDLNVCTVRFEIFVRDNIKAMHPSEVSITRIAELQKSLLGVFPIVDRSNDVTVIKPRVIIPASSDGNGFHYSTVQATVQN